MSCSVVFERRSLGCGVRRSSGVGLGLGLVEIFFVSVQLYVLCLVKARVRVS